MTLTKQWAFLNGPFPAFFRLFSLLKEQCTVKTHKICRWPDLNRGPLHRNRPQYQCAAALDSLQTKPEVGNTYRKLRFHLLCRDDRGLALLAAALIHEVIEDVHGHGEDDGRVVLGRDAAQRLQVAELKEQVGLVNLMRYELATTFTRFCPKLFYWDIKDFS